MKRSLALSVFSATLVPMICLAASRIPPEREVDTWLKQRSQTHPGLAQKILEVNGNYEVVFIPGILGSQLRIGSFTYGEDPISAEKLVFDPEQNVETATLNRFKAQALIFSKKVDIYGNGLDLLMQTLGGSKAYEFSYDWRNDINVLAKKLQNELMEKLPRKRVLIVAHSMGGVIAWHWKNRYPRAENSVKLIGLVLLGSPLQGSCEPARMLVQGYGPPDGGTTFDKVATRLVFGDAHPAIFTFPSVYQLMPRFDDANPCIKMQNGKNIDALNHHKPDTWLGRPGGSYNAARKFHAATGLSEDEYAKRVRRAVEAGERFRESFNLSQESVVTYLLYSKELKLQQYYLVRARNEWLDLVKQSGTIDSDGRVPARSAQNERYFDLSKGAYWKLTREHGELLADDDFAEFVRTTLQLFMSKAKQVEILDFATKDPALSKEITAFNWAFDPSVKSWLIDIPEIRAAQEALAKYTIERLTGQRTGLAQAAIARAREVETWSTHTVSFGGSSVAAALYQSAMVLEPDSIDARSLNRLGLIQIKQARYGEAVTVLSKASKVAKSSNDKFVTSDIREKIDANLQFASDRKAARTASHKPAGDFASRPGGRI